MNIILIRHPESTKNVNRQFSSSRNQEPLTDNGLAQVKDIVWTIDGLTSEGFFTKPLHLYAATSLRSKILANELIKVLEVPAVFSPYLNSIDSGSVSGLNREEMEKVAPGYFQEMTLYESGVQNAYSIDHPGESLLEFESKLMSFLQTFETKRGTAFIILHKSAATAALINYSRRMGKYPKTFFGYIPLDTASFSMIDINSDRIDIIGANMSCSSFTKAAEINCLRVCSKKWEDKKWRNSFFGACVSQLNSLGALFEKEKFLTERTMPWSFVGKITLGDNDYFCKSVSDASYFEPSLTSTLNRISNSVVRVIRYSAVDGWLITKGESQIKNLSQASLIEAISEYAKLQIISIRHKSTILKTGLPRYDLIPAHIRLSSIINRLNSLPQSHPSYLSKTEENLIKKAIPLYQKSEDILRETPLEATIDHGDLLEKNLLLDKHTGGVKWFDFGDSSWGHPFISLDLLLDKRHSSCSKQTKNLVIDTYLNEWADYYREKYSKRDLRILLENAIRLAAIRRIEIRLSTMELTSADQLGEMAAYGKDEFLYACQLLIDNESFI